MLSQRTGTLAQFLMLALCSGAPLTAVAQGSVSPPAVAEATLDFLPDQNDPAALRCDALADHPADPHRAGEGVAFEEISLVDALPACERAASRPPTRPRYQWPCKTAPLDTGTAHDSGRALTTSFGLAPSHFRREAGPSVPSMRFRHWPLASSSGLAARPMRRPRDLEALALIAVRAGATKSGHARPTREIMNR